jgi:hypothetical protein
VAKEPKFVKQKLGILQRLMMKLQGCWLSMGLWNCWLLILFITTDIVSENKFNFTVFSSVLVSNDKSCRDANCHTCFYSLSLLNVQLVEKKK